MNPVFLFCEPLIVLQILVLARHISRRTTLRHATEFAKKKGAFRFLSFSPPGYPDYVGQGYFPPGGFFTVSQQVEE